MFATVIKIRDTLLGGLIFGTSLSAFAMEYGELTIIAKSNEPAAGFEDGFTYRNFFHRPVINDSGEIVFSASVLNPGGNTIWGDAIWRNNSPVLRRGDAVPNFPAGTTFTGFFAPGLNDSGTLLFGGGIDFGDGTFGRAFWKDDNIIVQEDAAISSIPGASHSSLGNYRELTSQGDVAYTTSVKVPNEQPSITRALWFNQTLVARQGQLAPDTPSGTLFRWIGQSQDTNSNGDIIYFATLEEGTGGTNEDNRFGIWLNEQLLAREGDQVPGLPPGVLLRGFGPPRINDNGEYVFSGFLRHNGTTIDSTNDYVILLNNQIFYRKGNTLPGAPAGAELDGVQTVKLAEDGSIMWLARLTIGPGGITADNNQILYQNSTPVAFKGQQAPGHNPGVVFGDFLPYFSPSDDGQFAFGTYLSTGINGNNSDVGLYLGGPQGELLPVLGKNGSVEGLPTHLIILTDNASHSRRSFNNSSMLVFTVRAQAMPGESFQQDLIATFVPHIRWRDGNTDQWFDANNWTISQLPNNHHQVYIETEMGTDIEVTDQDAHVKALTIRSTEGLATLKLGGNKLSIVEVLNVGTNGEIIGGEIEAGSFINSGRVTVAADQTIVTGDYIANEGTIAGAGHLEISGTYSHAQVENQVHEASLSFLPTANVEIFIGGINPGVDHDVIATLGNIDFGGTLKLKSLNGFMPQIGDDIQIFAAASTSGEFQDIDTSELSLPSGVELDISLLSSSGRLTFIATATATETVPFPKWALILLVMLLLKLSSNAHPSLGELRRRVAKCTED
ncbi:MAG: choice-of-anchor tandem repeat NxxGxxAF-containing protein [Pseudomonadota bacterium]